MATREPSSSPLSSPSRSSTSLRNRTSDPISTLTSTPLVVPVPDLSPALNASVSTSNELHYDPPLQPFNQPSTAVEAPPSTLTPTPTQFAVIMATPTLTPILPDTPPTPLTMPTDQHRTSTRRQSKPTSSISLDTSSDLKHVPGHSRASAQSYTTSLPSPLEQRATHSRRGSATGSRGTSVGVRSSGRKSTTPGPGPVSTAISTSTRARRASQASTYSNDAPAHVRRSSRGSVPELSSAVGHMHSHSTRSSLPFGGDQSVSMQIIEEASEIPQDSHLQSVNEVQTEQAETPASLMDRPQTEPMNETPPNPPTPYIVEEPPDSIQDEQASSPDPLAISHDIIRMEEQPDSVQIEEIAVSSPVPSSVTVAPIVPTHNRRSSRTQGRSQPSISNTALPHSIESLPPSVETPFKTASVPTRASAHQRKSSRNLVSTVPDPASVSSSTIIRKGQRYPSVPHPPSTSSAELSTNAHPPVIAPPSETVLARSNPSPKRTYKKRKLELKNDETEPYPYEHTASRVAPVSYQYNDPQQRSRGSGPLHQEKPGSYRQQETHSYTQQDARSHPHGEAHSYPQQALSSVNPPKADSDSYSVYQDRMLPSQSDHRNAYSSDVKANAGSYRGQAAASYSNSYSAYGGNTSYPYQASNGAQHHYLHHPSTHENVDAALDGRTRIQEAGREEYRPSPKRQKYDGGYREVHQRLAQGLSPVPRPPTPPMEARNPAVSESVNAMADGQLHIVQENPPMQHDAPSAVRQQRQSEAQEHWQEDDDVEGVEIQEFSEPVRGNGDMDVDRMVTESVPMITEDSFHVTTAEDFPTTNPLNSKSKHNKSKTPRRPRKNREVTMEDMPQYPKDIVKEKEKEEEKEKDKDKEDEEEDEEEKFPTEPNFQQIFFGKWNILPWYFSPYPPLKIDLVKYWEEKEKEMSSVNYSSNFAPNGRFVKGNQISGRKSGGRKRGVSVINGDDATTDGRSDSVKAPFTKKEEPTYAKGHTLWVCERCFKYCDRPLEGYTRADGTVIEPHLEVDCTVDNPPGELMYDDGGLDEQKEAAVPVPAATPAGTTEKAARDAERGDFVAESPPIDNSLGGVGGMPSSLGTGQASVSSHPSAAVETDAHSANTATYSGTANNQHSAYGPNPSYNAPSNVPITPEEAMPLYPTSTPYATTHHGQFNTATNVNDPPTTTDWNATIPVPIAFPLSKAKFDNPNSPMEPHPSTQRNSPMFDGQRSQAAFANTSGPYATSGHSGVAPTPGHLSMVSTVDGHGSRTNPGRLHVQPEVDRQQKAQVQDREGRTRIYEIDSGEHPEWRLFCQNMALFGKLFLKEKFVFYECHDFIFYIITSVQNGVETVVGFFTKEKDTTNENNLACIIVFPPYQNRGFGSLMIKFSYALSKRDGKVGSPEKPLSDLGLRSYYTVWANSILDYILEHVKVSNTVVDRPKGGKRLQKHPKPLGSNRTYSVIESHDDGSAHVHLSFECTLQQLADAAFLTVADASFALGEIGIVWYSLGGTKGEWREKKPGAKDSAQVVDGKVVLTRDLVQRIGKRWRFRKAPLNTAYLLF